MRFYNEFIVPDLQKAKHPHSQPLPHAAPSQFVEQYAPTASPAPGGTGRIASTPMRLLLVDDNPRARHSIVALMSTHPEIQIVGEVSNGHEAIAAIETVHPDVILMDIQMPLMDGMETTRLIKSCWPQVRVVTLTIYPHYEAESRSAGADAFLVKGCSSQEMLSAITGTNDRTDPA